MNRATLHLELVTPAFLGGADRREPAEWRAASVRGQLRWWFRAVAGAVCAGNPGALREAEERIFGSTRRSAALQIRALGDLTTFPAGERCDWGHRLGEEELAKAWGVGDSQPAKDRLRLQKGASNPIHYLAYGCVLWNKERKEPVFEHGYIEAGQPLTLEVQWRRPVESGSEETLRKALWCWLHLGGLGARSRRGFGSLRCAGLEGDGFGTSADFALSGRGSLRKRLQEILPSRGESSAEQALPAWSYLSARSRVCLGRDSARSWDEALMQAGAWLIAFRRRYGSQRHSHPALGPGSVRDYEWASRNGGAKGKGIPDRAGFGLPLPFGEGGETVTWGDPDHDHRRASPLLLHVARFDVSQKAEYLPVFTWLPAMLVPEGERLFLKDRPETGADPGEEALGIAGRFLDDLCGKQLVSEVRP